MQLTQYTFQFMLVIALFSMILKMGFYGQFTSLLDILVCSMIFFTNGKEKKFAQGYTIYVCATVIIEYTVTQLV